MAVEELASRQNIGARLSKGVSGFLVALWCTWCVGVSCAVPYFAWSYMHEHSFFESTIYGPFVSSGKGLIWPYYVACALSHSGGLTADERDSIAHWLNAEMIIQEDALSMRQLAHDVEGAASADVVADRMKKSRENRERALSEARQVMPSHLSRVHPDLPKAFTESFLPCLKAGAADRFDDLFRASVEWEKWLDSHEDQLRVPRALREKTGNYFHHAG